MKFFKFFFFFQNKPLLSEQIKKNFKMSTSTPLKRLMGELKNLQNEPDPNFVAGPVEDFDLFVWHFTIKGPPDTSFEGGIYHGKIVFPQQYPMKPPDIYFLTPSGRYEINKKICLSATSYHPESWSPSWDVRTLLTSLIAFLPTKAEGAVGAIEAPDIERKYLAKESRNWKCKECNLYLEPSPLPENKIKEIKLEEDKIINEELIQDNIIINELNKSEEENKLESENNINEITNNFQDIIFKFEEEEEKKKEEIIIENNDNMYNFVDLKELPNSKKKRFYPFYDIPIIILFLLLCFLILNDVNQFITFF